MMLIHWVGSAAAAASMRCSPGKAHQAVMHGSREEREKERGGVEIGLFSLCVSLPFLLCVQYLSFFAFSLGRTVRWKKNALPWRLTPICHSPSIIEHLAAPEQATVTATPRQRSLPRPTRRANKYISQFLIFTHRRRCDINAHLSRCLPV